jgi:5,5'-dehydrodivanillate O-demethylase oxygenase subunit
MIDLPMHLEPWQDVFHIGPGTLAGRYLRHWWHPVAVAKDVPVGRAKPVRTLGEELTLYRGEDGTPHLVAFRCAHRGTQLSTGWVEGDNIRCFYHGWVYGPDGQCVEQPAEPEPFCSRIKIKSYPVQEYVGLIFAYLGEGEPPELPRYPELEADGILRAGVYTWPCTYFSSLENGVDHAHGAFVHGEVRKEVGWFGVPMVTAEEVDWGIKHVGTRPDGGQRVVCHQWPNLNQRKGGPPRGFPDAPWTDAIAWRVPVDDTHVSSFGVNLIHLTGADAEQYLASSSADESIPSPRAIEVAEAALRGEERAWEATGRIASNVQDYTAQVGQGAIPDRTIEHMGRSDVGVILLRRIWERELRALAEGRPLKEWTQREGVEPTTGLAVVGS